VKDKLATRVRKALTRKGVDIFEPATSRLLWIPFHVAIIGILTSFVSSLGLTGLSLMFLLPVSLIIGMAYAGLAFVGHESLHGQLTRSKWLKYITGFIGFLPFCISPKLWVAWHNNVHHANTNVPGKDPDAYPTIEECQRSFKARASVILAAPGSRRWRGIITLLIGFTTQSTHVLLAAKYRGYMKTGNYLAAILETIVGITFWTYFAFLVGFPAFLMTFIIPLMVANAIVMGHIITNHSLSPLADKNDALQTSLSVTVPKWFEFYTLGFGYHVEHHLFPAMSNRYAPHVHKIIRKQSNYQIMPLSQALYLMYVTPRIYKEKDILVDYDTGEKYFIMNKK
jgi:fatty acid desaturase